MSEPARRRLALPFVAGGATVALILAIALLGTNASLLPWGCYRFERRSLLLMGFVIAVFAALPALVRWVRSDAAAWKKLVVLVPFGACLQWAVVLAEAKGAQPMQEKLLETGHAEFISIALRPLPPDLIARYEELIREGTWAYPHSKPPGTLLAYRGLVALAQGGAGAGLRRLFYGPAERFDGLSQSRQRLAAVFFVLLPFFTFFTLVPLYLLARNLAGARVADTSALLFLSTPMVLIVVMHLDGALFPLLGTTALWLTHEGFQRRRGWEIVLGGLVLSAGLFTTFGLLPLVPVAGALVAGEGLASDGWTVAGRRRMAAGLALFAAGLGVLHLVLVLGLHYRPLVRYAGARAYHHVFKASWPLGPWLWGNLVQFALWLGLPLTLAAAAGLLAPLRAGRWRSACGAMSVALALCILAVDLLGDVKSEVMRLWLFWVPLLAIAAAGRLVVWEEEGRRPLLGATVLLQIVYVFAFRTLYDCH